MRRLRAVDPILEDQRAIDAFAADRHAHDLVGTARVLHGERGLRLLKIVFRQDTGNIVPVVQLLHDLVAPHDRAGRVAEQAGHRDLADHTRRRTGVLRKHAVHELLLRARIPYQQREQHRKEARRHGRRPDQHIQPPCGQQPRRKPCKAEQQQRKRQRRQQNQLRSFHSGRTPSACQMSSVANRFAGSHTQESTEPASRSIKPGDPPSQRKTLPKAAIPRGSAFPAPFRSPPSGAQPVMPAVRVGRVPEGASSARECRASSAVIAQAGTGAQWP